MPTYQYACTNPGCGHKFDLVQSFTDPAATECPVCEAPVRKVFSPVGVVFKGSGFYRTDSRAGNGKGKSDTRSRDAGKESAAASTTKSDAGSAAAGSGPSSGTKTPAQAGASA